MTQWKVAWKEVKAHPIFGTGARTCEIYWNRLRPNSAHIRDVHNLYLQTLAELGAIGLVILLAALVIPLVTGVRARGRLLVAAASLGVYVAYLLHAIVDWDWEITGVMPPFLVSGVAGPRARLARRPAPGCAPPRRAAEPARPESRLTRPASMHV